MPQDQEKSKPRKNPENTENLKKDIPKNSGADMEKLSEQTNVVAHRDPAQVHDHKGEAQNINDDAGRPMHEEDEIQHARNKANEGGRQQPEEGNTADRDRS